MLKTLIGDGSVPRGMDLYFERWDGQATTVEAFIECFAEASGRDLTAFFAWYEQAGTPGSPGGGLRRRAKALDLTFTRLTAPTPGQPDKQPLPIPIAIGLLDEDGRPLRDDGEVIVLDSPRAPCASRASPRRRWSRPCAASPRR
jgi:aminopeptidase N